MNAPRPFSRILLSRMKFIGDIVLTTPVIRSLRNAFPGAYIAYMGEKKAVSLLEHNPHLNELIPFDFSKPTLIEQPRVAWLLRRRKFDLAIDLFNNPRSALLTRATGARVRVGAERKGRGSLYTIQVRDDGNPKTAIEFHNQFIRAVGVQPASNRTEIFLTEDEKREAKIYLQWLDYENNPLDPAKPIVGIHPGATWPAKRWLPERFAELADQIAAKLGAQIIITAGPNDDEAVRQVVRHSFATIKVLRALPLRQLAAIISHCAVYVANDNGTMHIGAALGVPTVGIFGPGEENIWFPYSSEEGHAALRRDVACHPCHLDFCNREGGDYMECMKLLDVQDVFRHVENAMRRRKPDA
ncbi:MAG: glycosyltransferase family 9 protein [Bacteroidetes bacterium]|nr:glycosyltransferase family 9 protein [Bacteroidota bacterium]MCW5894676.1 glycosyltransferase family 9 protein [Bacteroidota bacterium]